MTIAPDRLAAYADGELDPAEAAEVEAAIAADPALAAEVAVHRALRNRLAAHFAPIAEEPIPARLVEPLAAARPSAQVLDFTAARAARQPPRAIRRWGWMLGPALAASLVVTLFVDRRHADMAGYAQADLAAALDDQLVATQPATAPTRVLLSFADKSGALCRGFAGAAQSGIACRDVKGWRLVRELGGATGEGGDYRQAGSAAPALMAAIQDMAAGPALDADAERAAKAKGWR